MENPNSKSEGAAYLSAVHIKENFKPATVDFFPANLETTIARVARTHNDLEGHCEKLATEELQREFAQIRKEVKNYLVVLKSIHEIQTKDKEMWPVVTFFLDPETDVAEEPTMVKQQEARKLLHRFAGFSTNSTAIIETLIQKRLAHEAEKVRLMMERRKKKPAAGSGFLGKLGIKF